MTVEEYIALTSQQRDMQKEHTRSEILRPKEIQEILGGISRSYLDQLAQTDQDFPKVITLSPRYTGYRKSSFYAWLDKKELEASDAN